MINLGGKIVYHLGDTALFSDLRLVGERDPLDVALVCIGGHYTMDRHDAAIAAELIGARTVIPCHYDTFPPIETDAPGVQVGRGVAHGGGGPSVDNRGDPSAGGDLLGLGGPPPPRRQTACHRRAITVCSWPSLDLPTAR